MSLKQACLCLRTVEPLTSLLLLPLIKPRVYIVLLGRRTKIGLEIGSNSLLLQKLGSLMVTIGLVTPTLTKYSFMRLTLSMDFVFPSILSLESFSPSYNFP